MKSAFLALAAAVASVQATVVSMPYSLSGSWNTDMKVLSDVVPPVTGDFSGCYNKFDVNGTVATFTQMCQVRGSTAEVAVNTLSLPAASVVACGQNQQLGTSYGVFGGSFSMGTQNTTQVGVCVSFNRVDADHLTNSENAQVGMIAFTPPEDCSTQFPGKVCCPASPPSLNPVVPTLPFTVSGQYKCTSGTCNTDPVSSYCSDGSNYRITQIGVGMSVGGIGLLLVTLACIFVISSLVQG